MPSPPNADRIAPVAFVVLLVLAALSWMDATAETVTASTIPHRLPTWETIALPAELSLDQLYHVAISPDNADTLVLATNNGLYRSTNAGDDWTRLAPELFDGPVTEVTFAPNDAQRLFARIWHWAMHRSDDGGTQWIAVTLPPSPCGMTVAPTDANRLYARSCGGDNTRPALYRSDDGGVSWLAPSQSFTHTLDALAVSPVDANLLVATTFDRVFVSRDAGATWDAPPLGVRYFGRPLFDPAPPYTLYIGHWTGLTRSTDGLLTWQESDSERDLTTLVISPAEVGQVLGGRQGQGWQLASSGDHWRALPWDAPTPLEWLGRSFHDGRTLYARTERGLWRLNHADQPTAARLFLPIVAHEGMGSHLLTPTQRAVMRLNEYRALVDVSPVQLHSAIVTAAQNHANYHMLNVDDPSAWTHGPHGEVDGKPGFTGRWPSDRLGAAGYPWQGGAEVMHFIGDPQASVDGWMATIYHRVIPLAPGAQYAGYGSGKSARTAVDVMNMASGPLPEGRWTSATPHPLAYPGDGQLGVPTTWGGGESPDPLPPDALRPVGYPFTLQGVRGKLTVAEATFHTAGGQAVAVHPNPPDCPTFNCFALIAVTPLRPNTTYVVSARGDVAGVAFDRTWRFTTGATINASDASPRRNAVVGPPWQPIPWPDPQPPQE